MSLRPDIDSYLYLYYLVYVLATLLATPFTANGKSRKNPLKILILYANKFPGVELNFQYWIDDLYTSYLIRILNLKKAQN